MIAETKDSIANITTIAGSGAAVMNVNEMLTFALILTGIVLNIIRIIEIKKKRKES